MLRRPGPSSPCPVAVCTVCHRAVNVCPGVIAANPTNQKHVIAHLFHFLIFKNHSLLFLLMYIPLRWLILCVNLTGLTDVHITGKILSLGMSVHFNLYTENGTLLLPRWVDSIQCTEDPEEWNRTKRQKKSEFALSALAGTFIFCLGD